MRWLFIMLILETKWRQAMTNDNLNTLMARIIVWANDRNLIQGSSAQAQMLKFLEEAGELAHGVARGEKDKIEDSVGDIFVVLTILCRQLDIDMIECVDKAYNEIKDRKGKMVDGIFLKEE